MRNRATRARVGGVLAPREAGAPRRRLARLRQAVAATGVVAVGVVAACIDDRGVGPRAHDPVRLALAVAVAQAGALASPNIQAEIFYLRSPEAGPPDRRPLGVVTQNVTPTTTQITLRVDIAPCLADPGHLTTPTGGYEGDGTTEDPTCDLEVELTFRDGATALDRAVVAVPGVKPGAPATAPGGVSLVAAGVLELSPSAITLGIDQAVQLTATVRDRAGAPLVARPVVWSSATAAVVVNPTTSSTNSDGVATTTVAGVSEAGPVRVIATSGVQADTTEVNVVVSRGSLVVDKDPAPEVLLGSTVAVTATVLGPNDQPAAGRTVTWTSSDPSIATLASPTSVTDANGVATIGVSGLFVGSVDITADSEGLTDLVAVNVQPIMTFLDDVNQWAATGINDAGMIVGSQDFEFFGSIGNFGGAYVLQPGGSVERLDLNNNGSAHDVNAAGLVAGSIELGAALFEGRSARPLPDLESGTSFINPSEALALNDAGDAVGYDLLVDGTTAPVLWPSEGGVSAVSPPSDLAWALGINAARQVVGYTVTFSSDAGAEHWDPFIWTAASGPLPLGTFPGLMSTANDINDAGVVVGGADGPPGSATEGVPAPYVWRPATPNGTTGTITSLGTLNPTLPVGEALAINEAGLVAGWGVGELGGFHAFLWVPPVGSATSGRTVDLGGETFSAALDINNRFQAVGVAFRQDNTTFGPVMWTLSAEVLDRRVLTAQQAAAQVAAQRRKFGTSSAALGLTGPGARGRPVSAQAVAEVAARIRALRTGRAPGAAALRHRAR